MKQQKINANARLALLNTIRGAAELTGNTKLASNVTSTGHGLARAMANFRK